MSSKKELIERIVHLLLTEFEPYNVSGKDRAFLEQSSLSYLQAKLQQLQSESAAKQVSAIAQRDPEFQRAQAELEQQRQQTGADLAWLNIVRTPINGRFVIGNDANRQIISSWVNPGEVIYPQIAGEWFKKVLAESPALANQLAWESADARDPVKRQQATAAQLEQDRQTFADACRQLHIGNNEANFGIIRSTLGENLSLYQIQQAIQSGAVRLSPATQQEMAQWAQEAVEERNEFLLTADNHTLRNIARREGLERAATATKAEADRQFEASKARDTAIGFPALPETWQGQKLDAAFIRSCNVETQKLLTKRFGSAALDARLRGN
jgi:hypothetical protein